MSKKPFRELDRYGTIQVGQRYAAKQSPINPLDGEVLVTAIRSWADGLIDVELEQGPFTAYVRIDLLMRDDPLDKDPLYRKI